MAEKKRGFTLIELVVVLAVLAILAAIAIPILVPVVARAQAAADTASVRALNEATAAYRTIHNKIPGDVFEGIGSDEARIQVLIDEKLLEEKPKPKEIGAAFTWSVDNQVWVLSLGE